MPTTFKLRSRERLQCGTAAAAGCWRTVIAAGNDQVGGLLQLGLPAARLAQLELQLLVLGTVVLRPRQLLLSALALPLLVRQLLAGRSTSLAAKALNTDQAITSPPLFQASSPGRCTLALS